MIQWRKLSAKALHWGEPMLLEERCVHTHSAKATCALCRQVCPLDGIFFDVAGLPRLRRCDSCGRCVAICPNKAWQLDEKKIPWHHRTLILECIEDTTRPGLGCAVHCMRQFSAEDVAFWLQHFESVVLILDHDACRTCTYDWSVSLLETMLNAMPIQHKERFIRIQTKEERDAYAKRQEGETVYTRRALSSEAKKRGMHYAEDLLARQLEDKNSFITQREKLSYAVADTDESVIFHQHRKLSVNKCQFCGACVKLCPTEALSLYEDENLTRALTCEHLRCTGCGLCVDICPVDGLFLGYGLSQQDILQPKEQILIYAPEKTCNTCDMSFWEALSTDAVCPFCRTKK